MSIFGGSKPQPAPVPVNPSSSAEAEAKRAEAERAAVAQRAMAGRRSTMVGGMEMAESDQMARGEEFAKKRAARTTLG